MPPSGSIPGGGTNAQCVGRLQARISVKASVGTVLVRKLVLALMGLFREPGSLHLAEEWMRLNPSMKPFPEQSLSVLLTDVRN